MQVDGAVPVDCCNCGELDGPAGNLTEGFD